VRAGRTSLGKLEDLAGNAVGQQLRVVDQPGVDEEPDGHLAGTGTLPA
jgi:hypothetical protein